MLMPKTKGKDDVDYDKIPSMSGIPSAGEVESLRLRVSVEKGDEVHEMSNIMN